MLDNALLVIPAIKKNAVIPDQLIKKLDGITLIQRAINTAKELTHNILVMTDSEEISLIARRNGVAYYKDASLRVNSENVIEITLNVIASKPFEHIILYRANTPLVGSVILQEAYQSFLRNQENIITSVKKLDKKLLHIQDENLAATQGEFFKELKAFYIFSKNLSNKVMVPFLIGEEESIEIESYRDWWICEKILQRKRIVFHVIGSKEIGMGHIYHSLALAHEITDHEVIFVCDAKYELVVEKIAAMDYKVLSSDNVAETILELNPDLIINDVLNTSEEFVQTIKSKGAKVVNFEDLGLGAYEADLVINELYDTPQLEGKHFLWGYKYLALRDEFVDAIPYSFKKEVSALLITFGGTDQHNLTLRTLQSIISDAMECNVKIFIVCGLGYMYKEELQSYIDEHPYKEAIEVTYGIAVMSQIMEKTDIAISSNGRTVYELAQMNIPSVIVSHHDREDSHSFAILERGFLNLGVYDEAKTPPLIAHNVKKLLQDEDYRKLLYLNVKRYSFIKNKEKVVKIIMELL